MLHIPVLSAVVFVSSQGSGQRRAENRSRHLSVGREFRRRRAVGLESHQSELTGSDGVFLEFFRLILHIGEYAFSRGIRRLSQYLDGVFRYHLRQMRSDEDARHVRPFDI